MFWRRRWVSVNFLIQHMMQQDFEAMRKVFQIFVSPS